MEDPHSFFVKERSGYKHSAFTEIKASMCSDSLVLNHGRL